MTLRCERRLRDGAVTGQRGEPGRHLADRVPRALAFASVPDLAHSQKPRLDALFEPAFSACDADRPEPLRGLELFGRGTQPYWTTFGDQALEVVLESPGP